MNSIFWILCYHSWNIPPSFWTSPSLSGSHLLHFRICVASLANLSTLRAFWWHVLQTGKFLPSPPDSVPPAEFRLDAGVIGTTSISPAQNVNVRNSSGFQIDLELIRCARNSTFERNWWMLNAWMADYLIWFDMIPSLFKDSVSWHSSDHLKTKNYPGTTQEPPRNQPKTSKTIPLSSLSITES